MRNHALVFRLGPALPSFWRGSSVPDAHASGDIGPTNRRAVWSGRCAAVSDSFVCVELMWRRPLPVGGQVGLVEGDDPKRTRTMLKRLKWAITIFFLTLDC